MKNIVRKNWPVILVFVAGILLGLVFDQLVLKPNEPYMLGDVNYPTVDLPFKYMPVEMTGGDISKAVKMSACKVPEQFLPYVHNKPQGDWNIMNPEGKLGQAVKDWAWPVVFTLLIATSVYAIYKYKKGDIKIGKRKKNNPVN